MNFVSNTYWESNLPLWLDECIPHGILCCITTANPSNYPRKHRSHRPPLHSTSKDQMSDATSKIIFCTESCLADGRSFKHDNQAKSKENEHSNLLESASKLSNLLERMLFRLEDQSISSEKIRPLLGWRRSVTCHPNTRPTSTKRSAFPRISSLQLIV